MENKTRQAEEERSRYAALKEIISFNPLMRSQNARNHHAASSRVDRTAAIAFPARVLIKITSVSLYELAIVAVDSARSAAGGVARRVGVVVSRCSSCPCKSLAHARCHRRPAPRLREQAEWKRVAVCCAVCAAWTERLTREDDHSEGDPRQQGRERRQTAQRGPIDSSELQRMAAVATRV